MTPSGGIAFALVVIGAAMITGDLVGLAAPLVLCAVFATLEVRDRAVTALAWSAGIVAPLALFLCIVWVGVVGRSPEEIAAGATGTRVAALAHVATVCTRLFLVALAIQLVLLHFACMTPLQFIRAMRAPSGLKRLLVLTLSWIDTILHAVDRSRTALITAGIIAPRLSVKNAAHGFILVQTVWLSVITIALGRLRDKWPAENTLARLDEALQAPPQPLRFADGAWLAAAIATAIVAKVA